MVKIVRLPKVILTIFTTWKMSELGATNVHRIFVYGTLKRGQPNYFRLQDSAKYGVSKFLGEAKMKQAYPMVVASRYNVPVMLNKEGEGKVVYGELYEVDNKMLEHLDRLESHPELYTRTPMQCIMLESETVVDCEVYLMFNFKPHLLSLPHLSSYSDAVRDKGLRYMGKDKRNEDYSIADDIKN